ncbi:hypothetical protein ACIPUD_11165 [Bradyrhizobium sp. CAR08]
MSEAPDQQTKSVIRSKRVLHLRAAGGSTYGDELLDQAGNVIGYCSTWVGTGKKHGKSKSVYTLKTEAGDSPEFATAAEFREAYAKKLENDKRDAEWKSAEPPAGDAASC